MLCVPPNGWYKASGHPRLSFSAVRYLHEETQPLTSTLVQRSSRTRGSIQCSQAERGPGSEHPGPLGSPFRLSADRSALSLQIRFALSTPAPPHPQRGQSQSHSSRKLHHFDTGALYENYLDTQQRETIPHQQPPLTVFPCIRAPGLLQALRHVAGLTAGLLICYLQNVLYHSPGTEIPSLGFCILDLNHQYGSIPTVGSLHKIAAFS